MPRLFVKHDKEGRIVAVSKRDQLPPGQDSPFDAEPECQVIEISASRGHAALMALEPHEIHLGYCVDLKKRVLKPLTPA